MEKDQSSPLLSPRTKELNNNNNNNDRLKRDEWSEGAVSTLLEAYEGKWVLRNRAKLKGQDWEDVAKQVSGRSNNTKSAKTQTQCKNKIESMKKRYRSESVAADAASSWPLYSRLDLLLRGNPNPAPPVMQKRNSDDDRVVKDGKCAQGDGNNNINICGKSSMEKNNPIRMEESDSSTPAPAAAAVYTTKSKKGEIFRKNKVTLTMKRKAREEDENETMNWEEESCSSVIRWVAEVVVKSEKARMETVREIERMRAEAEAKRGELDLKRTQIIANTQLEIAKLLITNRGPDASFKIGTS